jgi:hypothetical protein
MCVFAYFFFIDKPTGGGRGLSRTEKTGLEIQTIEVCGVIPDFKAYRPEGGGGWPYRLYGKENSK